MPQLLDHHTTKHVGAGLTLAATVGLFAYGGLLLDQKTGLQPLFLILGVLLGSAGGFLHVVAVVAPEMLPKKNKDKHQNNDKRGPGAPTAAPPHAPPDDVPQDDGTPPTG